MVVDGIDAAGDEAGEAQPEHYQQTPGQPPEDSQNEMATARQHPEPPPLPDRIVAVLRQKPTAGRRAIAAMLDTTESTVRYHLDKLRAAEKIERVGPDNGGYWKVLSGSASDPASKPDSRSCR